MGVQIWKHEFKTDFSITFALNNLDGHFFIHMPESAPAWVIRRAKKILGMKCIKNYMILSLEYLWLDFYYSKQ